MMAVGGWPDMEAAIDDLIDDGDKGCAAENHERHAQAPFSASRDRFVCRQADGYAIVNRKALGSDSGFSATPWSHARPPRTALEGGTS
jgi:hypothetical protein